MPRFLPRTGHPGSASLKAAVMVLSLCFIPAQAADLYYALDARGKTLNFYVPDTMGKGATMLTVTGGPANIDGATINVGIEGTRSPLKAGETLFLIDAPLGLTGETANSTSDGSGMPGVTLDYRFDITQCAANKLCATVARSNPARAAVSGNGSAPSDPGETPGPKGTSGGLNPDSR